MRPVASIHCTILCHPIIKGGGAFSPYIINGKLRILSFEMRPKNIEDDIIDMGFHVNHIKKFCTSEFVSKFILKNMGQYPEWRFMDLIDDLIDQAFDSVKKEGMIPQQFSVIFFSETLDTPIYIPLRPRVQNNVDLIMNGILLPNYMCANQYFRN